MDKASDKASPDSRRRERGEEVPALDGGNGIRIQGSEEFLAAPQSGATVGLQS